VSEHVQEAAISRGSPLPLHVQIRDLLLDRIERGELAPGARLQRERALAEQLGVSLAPVRQAILDLVKEGYLVRQRGRGTFVRGPRLEEKIAILSSFTKSLRAQGLEAEVRVLRQAVADAPAEVAHALGKRRVVAIERLALVEGEPVALLHAYLDADRLGAVAGDDLAGGSLYALLEERYGVRLERAEHVIEVVRLGGREAELLGAARGAPGLQVSGTTFDAAGVPVEFSRVVYREDRFRFSIESYRRHDAVVHVIGQPDEAPRAEEG
jgi:GntR family transcriptional regulator